MFDILLKSNRVPAANLGGLVVRREDCRSGMPGSNLPPHFEFFSFKIEATFTLTTFVEQKLKSLSQET